MTMLGTICLASQVLPDVENGAFYLTLGWTIVRHGKEVADRFLGSLHPPPVADSWAVENGSGEIEPATKGAWHPFAGRGQRLGEVELASSGSDELAQLL